MDSPQQRPLSLADLDKIARHATGDHGIICDTAWEVIHNRLNHVGASVARVGLYNYIQLLGMIKVMGDHESVAAELLIACLDDPQGDPLVMKYAATALGAIAYKEPSTKGRACDALRQQTTRADNGHVREAIDAALRRLDCPINGHLEWVQLIQPGSGLLLVMIGLLVGCTKRLSSPLQKSP